jgi:hypothetical protein
VTRKKEDELKGFVLVGTVALVAAALLGGCVSGTDGDGTSRTLTWALDIADELADAWNPDNKLTAIFGLWVDESGELDEPADNPAWAFGYTADDDSEGYVVLVHYDGHTASGEGPPPEITEELGDYSTEDVEDWMQAAIEKMEENPAPLKDYDYALSLLHVELVGRDYATVYFFQEADQDTDYSPEEWENLDIFDNFYAWVMIDAVDDTVFLTSW